MILALYGAGAMGREFRQIAEESGQWSGVVYIDDHAKTEELGGCPVYRFQVFRRQFTPDEVRFVVSIGEPKFRLEAFENMTRAGYSARVLIDKNARISPDAEIGEGTAVCESAFIGSQAKVGRNCYISRNASVGHDAVIGDHTRLGVNSFIGGHTEIGENAFIGAGAMLRDRIHVGAGSIAALGSVVFEDVPDNVTVIGNPARISGDGTQSAVYAPSKALETEQKAGQDAAKSIPELYWEVFTSCFEGVDFNPVTYRYQDEGWNSLAQMMLISRLEETFHVSIKGREAMRLKSYGAGLTMIKSKLEQKEKEKVNEA